MELGRLWYERCDPSCWSGVAGGKSAADHPPPPGWYDVTPVGHIPPLPPPGYPRVCLRYPPPLTQLDRWS